MTPPKFLWHDSVHKKFREDFLFLQLSFLPTYRRDEIFSRLATFFKERNILSHSVYEIYGDYDLLLRVWLPAVQQPATAFRKLLQSELEYLNCTRIVPFYVDGNPHHWLWWDKDKERSLIPSKAIIDDLSEDIIMKVDTGKVSNKEFKNLETKHVLKKYNPSKGIKFFIIIPAPDLTITPLDTYTEDFVSRLRDFLMNNQGIADPSIYFGTGFAWFLIEGKIILDYYHLLDELVQEINRAGVSAFLIKTYTRLSTGSKYPYYIENEEISSIQEPKVKKYDVIHYLMKREDNRFEIKASLSLNIDRYLRDKSQKGKFRDTSVAREGVLKTIVAFLNSKGGTILVGVIEAIRYLDLLKDPECDLNKLSRVGDKIVFGINAEYTHRGFEEFCERLSKFIEIHIGKDASAMITDIQKLEYGGKDLCLIHVPKGGTWYYLDNKGFYVRRANSTIALEGTEMDAYKKLYPRGSY